MFRTQNSSRQKECMLPVVVVVVVAVAAVAAVAAVLPRSSSVMLG